MKKKNSLVLLFPWITLFGMIVVIFLFSSENGIDSVDKSRDLIDYLIRFFNLDILIEQKPWLNKNRNFIFRKVLHFSEYGVLATLTYIALKTVIQGHRKAISAVMIIVAMISIFDEFHQSFIPYRNPKVQDVIIDCAGAFTGLIICLIFINIVKVFKRSGQQ